MVRKLPKYLNLTVPLYEIGNVVGILVEGKSSRSRDLVKKEDRVWGLQRHPLKNSLLRKTALQ